MYTLGAIINILLLLLLLLIAASEIPGYLATARMVGQI
jgi:hypothetical protein